MLNTYQRRVEEYGRRVSHKNSLPAGNTYIYRCRTRKHTIAQSGHPIVKEIMAYRTMPLPNMGGGSHIL